MLKMYSPSFREKMKGKRDSLYLYFRSPFRRMVLVTSVLVLVSLYCIYQETPRWEIEKLKYNGNLPVLYRDVTPEKDKFNIYLLDTSFKAILNTRTLCALESYCRLNPTAVIWMVLTSPSLEEQSSTTVEELRRSCLLKVVAADVVLTLKNTPLAELPNRFGFWRSGILSNNLSDMMRLAIVYKSGGFYSDSDVLATQTVVTRKNFVPSTRDAFGYSGPRPFSYVMQERCSYAAENVFIDEHPWISFIEQGFVTPSPKSYACSEIGDPDIGRPNIEFYCKDLSVLEPSSFFGYTWQDWKKMFTEDSEAVCLDNLRRHSLGIHLFNKLSKGSHASPCSALYSLSKSSCPLIFEKNNGNVY